MKLMRRPILFGLSLCLVMGLPIGCTSGAMNTAKQDLDLLVENKVAFQQGKTDRALEIASEAVRVTPDRAEAWDARGFLYASQGRMEQALSDLTQAVRLDPANATYLSNLGVASLESGKADQALVAFNKALEVGPQSALALKHRGMAYRQLGKLQYAAHDFNAAILLDGQGMPPSMQIEPSCMRFSRITGKQNEI